MGKEPKKCNSCDGTGKDFDFNTFKRTEKDCYFCKGSGFGTKWTDEIVCPYCGIEGEESYEYSQSSEYDCGSCGKRSQLYVDHRLEFSTNRMDCLNDPLLHNWVENEFYKDKRRDEKSYCRCSKCHNHSWVKLDSTAN